MLDSLKKTLDAGLKENYSKYPIGTENNIQIIEIPILKELLDIRMYDNILIEPEVYYRSELMLRVIYEDVGYVLLYEIKHELETNEIIVDEIINSFNKIISNLSELCKTGNITEDTRLMDDGVCNSILRAFILDKVTLDDVNI